MILNIFDFLRDLLFDKNDDGYLVTKPIVKIVLGLFLLAIIVLLIILAIKKEQKLSNNEKIRRITFVSILSGLSIVLYMLKINLPIFLSFLDIQFSNVPALIGGFLFGPLSGAIIVLIRTLVKLPMTGTGGVGELADLIIGLVVVIVSSLIYHKEKTKKNAIKALIYASLSWVFIATFTNWLFIADFYVYTMFDGNEGVIVGALNSLPGVTFVTVDNYMLYYILIGIIPFNLVLSSMVSLVTFLVYKRVSNLFEMFGKGKPEVIKKTN
ncbi:MAG TPA: ECF transporter S component [Bacilli bacterium]